MPISQNILASKHMDYLLEGAAKGAFAVHSLITHVHAGHKVTYKHAASQFDKEGPGHYNVIFWREGIRIGTEVETSALAAKLSVLTYLESCVKQQEKQVA